MSETTSDPKAAISRLRSGFLISAAVNIFLVAFILGRLSTPSMMLPPFFDHPPHPDMAHGTDMPPFAQMEHMGQRHGGPHGDDRQRGDRHGNDGNPPAPPFIRDLIGPNALETKDIQASFEKVNMLRTEFAQTLAEKPMTKEEVKAYFAKFDTVMDAIKSNVQDKAAERIATLSDDERKALSQRLVKDSADEQQMHKPDSNDGGNGEKHPPFE